MLCGMKPLPGGGLWLRYRKKGILFSVALKKKG